MFREARILARRKRIQERLATAHQGDSVGGKEGEKKEEVGKGKQQIIESKRRLFRVKHRTEQDVTSVRVGGDEREQLHRIHEEKTRQVCVHCANRYLDGAACRSCSMCIRAPLACMLQCCSIEPWHGSMMPRVIPTPPLLFLSPLRTCEQSCLPRPSRALVTMPLSPCDGQTCFPSRCHRCVALAWGTGICNITQLT